LRALGEMERGAGDAYPAGSPFEFYDEKTAREAIEAAAVLVDLASKVGEDVAGR